MNQPLGTSLIKPARDFGQTDFASNRSFRINRGSEFFDQRPKRGALGSIDETTFLSLAVGFGGVGIVGHKGQTIKSFTKVTMQVLAAADIRPPGEGAGF